MGVTSLSWGSSLSALRRDHRVIFSCELHGRGEPCRSLAVEMRTSLCAWTCAPNTLYSRAKSTNLYRQDARGSLHRHVTWQNEKKKKKKKKKKKEKKKKKKKKKKS